MTSRINHPRWKTLLAFGKEELGLRTILGTLSVLVSVIVITATRPAKT